MIRRVLCAVLLLAGASCTWWNGPRREVFSGDLIKVPHARHAAASVDCVACHENIYDAKDLTVDDRPPEAKCLECHREWKEKGECGRCHTDVKHARPWPKLDPGMRVSHADHIPRVKEKCDVCHTRLPEPVRTRELPPPMSTCTSCHEHQADYDGGRCERCHTDLKRYPLQPVSSFTHRDGNYVRTHAKDARSAVDTCANCHEQSFCADCHAQTVPFKIELKTTERVDVDFIHRNDFLGRHMFEARSDPASCRRCHGTSFCESCHAANNLTPTAANPRDPHPPGWSLPGPNSHARAARSDITSCASCHEDGPRSICINCHKPGGVGGDPHPTGWSSRHSMSEIQHNSMCLYCHL